MEEIMYDCRWTNETDDKFIKDWQLVENTVFGGFGDDVVKRKYLDNVYGPSIMIVAYMDGKPVGADALWRNDVNGQESYASSDTSVLKSARGKGIMMEMIRKKTSMIPLGKYVFGSPNGKSYGGFVKCGWKEIAMYPALFFFSKTYAKECPEKMPSEYAKWWIIGPNKYHIKRSGHYYLISTTERKYLANLIAEVDKATAEMYPCFRKFSVFVYRSYTKPFLWNLLKKEPMHHISWQGDPKAFPYWKIDGYGE